MMKRMRRSRLLLMGVVSLMMRYIGNGKEKTMESTETLQSTIHTISITDPGSQDRAATKRTGYFLEEVTLPHGQKRDYWLGQYGSEKKTWIGSNDYDESANAMTLDQAMERARQIVRYL